MKVKKYTIDLSEQMAVCDANYIRLLKLLGDTRAMNQRVIALPHLGRGGREELVSVCIEVLEDFKYTSTICIRQQLLNKTVPEGGSSSHNPLHNLSHNLSHNLLHYTEPEMIVRIYHDAKTAEVTSYQNHRYFKAAYPVPNQFMYQCDEKEQLNLFLAEWLSLCLNEGLSDPDELQLEKISVF